MQAPLSSTASGQQLRTRPPLGLPPFTLSSHPDGASDVEFQEAAESRRLRAWSSLKPSSSRQVPEVSFSSGNQLPVAEGPGLAHDAGNLLGALRLYCDLLARPGVLREEHRHYAEELQLLSKRSGTLVDRLLNPAATGRCRAEAAAASVSVPKVVEQCRGLLSTIARRAVDVVYSAGAETPVPVAAEALERILVNLTKNAAEASTGAAAITLRVSRLRPTENARRRGGARSRIVLSIEDHGRGMSVAAVKVLMAPAPADPPPSSEEQPQRLHELGLVSSPAPGRGLGLRIVRELVESSGGELRLKSQSGCGTTVEIVWAVAGRQRSEAVSERQAVPVWNGTSGTKGSMSC